jgi:hypothetical protein
LVVTAKRAVRPQMVAVVLASTVLSAVLGIKALVARLEVGVVALMLTVVMGVRAAVMVLRLSLASLVKAILETQAAEVQVTTMTKMTTIAAMMMMVPKYVTKTRRSGIGVLGTLLE